MSWTVINVKFLWLQPALQFLRFDMWGYQLSRLKKMAVKKSTWALNTPNKLVNHLDEHDRGIIRYKSESVPELANATSSYTLSPQLWISSVRLTSNTKNTWADSKRENKGTPKSGIPELHSHLWLWAHREKKCIPLLKLLIICEMKRV